MQDQPIMLLWALDSALGTHLSMPQGVLYRSICQWNPVPEDPLGGEPVGRAKILRGFISINPPSTDMG